VLGFAAALGLALLVAGELSAATVTAGFDPSATLTGAVRYRNFGSGGGAEIRVGASKVDPQAEVEEGSQASVTGTLAFFIKRCLLSGAKPPARVR
jgi:hypothetical protein